MSMRPFRRTSPCSRPSRPWHRTTPTEDEYIDEDASLDEAIHQLVMGNRQSLLVKEGRGKDVAGVLRLTDVFAHVFQMMKQCQI